MSYEQPLLVAANVWMEAQRGPASEAAAPGQHPRLRRQLCSRAYQALIHQHPLDPRKDPGIACFGGARAEVPAHGPGTQPIAGSGVGAP